MKPNPRRVLATKQGSTELVVSSIETGGMLGSRITPACVKNMTVAKGDDVELLVVAKVMSLDPLTPSTSTVKSALLGLSEQCPLEPSTSTVKSALLGLRDAVDTTQGTGPRKMKC
jgi:hypothetical protein